MAMTHPHFQLENHSQKDPFVIATFSLPVGMSQGYILGVAPSQ